MATIEHNGWTIVDGVLSLPDGPTVVGDLDLEGCTSLTALPEGLTVGLTIDLDGCTALTALPDGLTVGEDLELCRCTSLTALPDGLTVGGYLDLQGCSSLKNIPKDLKVSGFISTDHFSWFADDRFLYLEFDLPHSVVAGMLGMRVYQIIDHPWLRDLGISEMTVIDVDHWGDIRLKIAPALERAA